MIVAHHCTCTQSVDLRCDFTFLDHHFVLRHLTGSVKSSITFDLFQSSIFTSHHHILVFSLPHLGTFRGDTVTYSDIRWHCLCFLMLPVVDQTVDLGHRTCWGVISWTSSILSAKSFQCQVTSARRHVWIKSNCSKAETVEDFINFRQFYPDKL